jgi:hypothetical protein
MPTADLKREPETELQRVERWRERALERAGYEEAAASELARRQDVDLHVAISLVEDGCPPETAARILI